jgi:hypothetical protein
MTVKKLKEPTPLTPLGATLRLGAIGVSIAVALSWNCFCGCANPSQSQSVASRLESTVQLPGSSYTLAERQNMLNSCEGMPLDYNSQTERGVILTTLALAGRYNNQLDISLVPFAEAEAILDVYRWNEAAVDRMFPNGRDIHPLDGEGFYW